MDLLMFSLDDPLKSMEFLGLILAGIAFIGYIGVWIIKNFPKFVANLITKWFVVDKHNHLEATSYRKKVVPKIRTILSELADEVGADRALLLEYSNGSSNLVGLPFLYITATVEVLRHDIHSVADQYQKTNVSIISTFIEKVEEDTFVYIRDLEEVKEIYPVLYNLMHKNGVKSALFYALYSNEATIGFIVVTTVTHYFERKDVLPKVAAEAQAISSLLNYDKLKEYLK